MFLRGTTRLKDGKEHYYCLRDVGLFSYFQALRARLLSFGPSGTG
jgi:hypothetical protein